MFGDFGFKLESIVDVTHAYKSLLAEKKALEITLKTLKTSPSTFAKPAAAATGQLLKPGGQLSASSRSVSISDVSEQEYNEASGAEPSSRVSVASSPDSTLPAESSNGDDKVAALMSNIQVLMEAKSSMEQSYLAEKKKMRVSPSNWRFPTGADFW